MVDGWLVVASMRPRKGRGMIFFYPIELACVIGQVPSPARTNHVFTPSANSGPSWIIHRISGDDAIGRIGSEPGFWCGFGRPMHDQQQTHGKKSGKFLHRVVLHVGQ